MDSSTPLERVLGEMPEGVVPGSRIVPDLSGALTLVRRLGGSVRSETRTAPGIASWAFVAAPDGCELLLWQDSATATGA